MDPSHFISFDRFLPKPKGEKQKGFDLNTKFSGSAITQSDKKMTVRFPASMLTESARDSIGLALSGQTPTGDQLAELIICIESQGYTSQIDKGKVSTIYRGASTVGDFEVGGDDGIVQTGLTAIGQLSICCSGEQAKAAEYEKYVFFHTSWFLLFYDILKDSLALRVPCQILWRDEYLEDSC